MEWNAGMEGMLKARLEGWGDGASKMEACPTRESWDGYD